MILVGVLVGAGGTALVAGDPHVRISLLVCLAFAVASIGVSGPIGSTTGILRLGRQELAFGAQRLVSPLDGSNTRRTWDGGQIILEDEPWRVDVFATQFVPVRKYDVNEPDAGQAFQGLYAAHHPGPGPREKTGGVLFLELKEARSTENARQHPTVSM